MYYFTKTFGIIMKKVIHHNQILKTTMKNRKPNILNHTMYRNYI